MHWFYPTSNSNHCYYKICLAIAAEFVGIIYSSRGKLIEQSSFLLFKKIIYLKATKGEKEREKQKQRKRFATCRFLLKMTPSGVLGQAKARMSIQVIHTVGLVMVSWHINSELPRKQISQDRSRGILASR